MINVCGRPDSAKEKNRTTTRNNEQERSATNSKQRARTTRLKPNQATTTKEQQQKQPPRNSNYETTAMAMRTNKHPGRTTSSSRNSKHYAHKNIEDTVAGLAQLGPATRPSGQDHPPPGSPPCSRSRSLLQKACSESAKKGYGNMTARPTLIHFKLGVEVRCVVATPYDGSLFVDGVVGNRLSNAKGSGVHDGPNSNARSSPS
eukprot:6492772-Amphidinium_carterae.5